MSERLIRRPCHSAAPSGILCQVQNTRPGLHSSDPIECGDEEDEAHEAGDGFLASQGDASEAFDPLKEILDLVALGVEVEIDLRLDRARGVRLNMRPIGRTELLVLITPRVIRNGHESQAITGELRQRIRATNGVATNGIADPGVGHRIID